MTNYKEPEDRNTAPGAMLPPPDTERWVTSRKAQVVQAVEGGVLSLKEACERYKLSEEEFASWQDLMRKHGVRGLRVTKVQTYREAEA